MKKLITAILIISWSLAAEAHNPAVASYYIFQMKDGWHMRTEFAWSLRNALTKSFPYLEEEEGITDEDYIDCVKDYLEVNLVLKADGVPLAIQTIQQIPGDHGHSYTFIIGLEGPVHAKEFEVKNKCLTELFRKQKNEVYLTTSYATQNRLFTSHDDEYVFVLEG